MQHERIVKIVEDRNRNKVHNGPRKNDNPEFPLGKLICHVNCAKKHTPYNIFVRLNQSSGKKKNNRIYKKIPLSWVLFISAKRSYGKINRRNLHKN